VAVVNISLLPSTSAVEGHNAEPRPGMRLRRPTPDQGLIHRPTNGGHCGGDGSVLRLRAVVTMGKLARTAA
jgi:hypothetical protein